MNRAATLNASVTYFTFPAIRSTSLQLVPLTCPAPLRIPLRPHSGHESSLWQKLNYFKIQQIFIYNEAWTNILR